MLETSPVGQNIIREDAWEKVCGRAVYIDDISLPGMLYGKVLRSTVAHAFIKRVNADKAKGLPGVKAVVTGAELQGKKVGLKIMDQPVLAYDRVRFLGERVAAVAATDPETAEAALELIEVEYEELEVNTDVHQAMTPGAYLLHPDFRSYEGGQGDGSCNVASHLSFSKGDIALGWREAAAIFENEYSTPVVHQGYLEPYSCLVDVHPSGEIVVWTNNKAPYILQRDLALFLGVPANRIRTCVQYIGGDFGGKGNLMDVPIAYHLSLRAGRPVKITMTREEDLIAGAPRHSSNIQIFSGVDKDGKLVAWQARVLFNSGAYASLKVNGYLGGTSRAAGPYNIPHVKIDGYSIYTNTVPCGHCRAPGDPQTAFAVESQMDFMAHNLGIDPADFRLKNVIREGQLSPVGTRWEDVRCEEVLRKAIEVSCWKPARKEKGRGWGIALTERNIGKGISAATIHLEPDGTVQVVIGVTDPGTGSKTVLRQIAAHELKIPLAAVRVERGDTSSAPFDTGSGGSRVTHVAGQAVRLAAVDLIRQVAEKLGHQWGVKLEEIELTTSGLFSDGNNKASWAEAARLSGALLGTAVFDGSITKQTCFAAQVASVEVDEETGQVQLLQYFAVHDIGKAINPRAAEGQIEGGVVQGMGFALLEQCRWVNGSPVDRDLAQYKMPLIGDIPEIIPWLLEGGSSPGPYNAKSVGEIVTSPVAPAVANAIFDAVGVRIRDLPMTPERVRAAMKLAARGEGNL